MMVAVNIAYKHTKYKKKKGDALVDVIVGVSLIAIIAGGAHDSIVNIGQQSEQLFFLNRATWKASSEIEILSGLEFDERYELNGSDTTLFDMYTEFTQIIEISYLDIEGGDSPSIVPTDSETNFQQIQVTINHPNLGAPLVLKRIIAR